MKTLRLSKQAMNEIRSSRKWKAQDKVEVFTPIDNENDDMVIVDQDDHKRSRNELKTA